MAYSAPRTWTTGDLATAAMLNQDLRDNVSFLANPPAARVYHNAVQAIPHNTPTILAFNQERFDTTGTMHDTTFANSHQIVAPLRGLYAITIQVEWNGGNISTGGYRANRTTPGLIASRQPAIQDTTVKDIQSASGVMFFEAGQTVELEAQSTNSSFVTGYMSMRFIAPFCPAPQQICAALS